MFLPPELFRVPGRVRDHYERFRAEAARLPGDAFIDWPQYGAYSAGWLSFPLKMTRCPPDLTVDWQRNRRMMPQTVAILEAMPGVVQFGLSRLLPGCHIYPHTDDVDPFVYRANLTLAAGGDAGMRAGGVIEPYEPHRVLVIDHREMHEAANLGQQARTSLLVDFVIDESERRALAEWRGRVPAGGRTTRDCDPPAGYRSGPGMTILRDPIHGDIELTGDEIRLVDTPEFQRLRGIKQLGSASLVFPGAVHTRFEHSIGTLHMCQQLLDACNRTAARDAECQTVTPAEVRILRICALLHDVTHIPYGHNIEDQTGLLPRHDRPERFQKALGEGELARELQRLGIRDEVLSVLSGTGKPVPPFWRQVVSDTIDADLMDYLRRDAHYTGLELRYDRRVVDYFRIDRTDQRMFVDCEKRGMLREDIVSELMRMLEIRFHFSERVYYHHAKIAAGALLSRMVELALRGGALTPATLQNATDESLLLTLEMADLGDAQQNARLRRFVAAYRRRALPKRVLVLPAYLNLAVQQPLLERYFTPGKPEARFEWEAAMESEARRAFGRELDVILYCPARSMQLKEAKTLVRFPGSGARTLPLDAFVADIPRLRDLRDSYPRLWKLYVFTSEPDPGVREKLQQICLAALPAGCTNALRL